MNFRRIFRSALNLTMRFATRIFTTISIYWHRYFRVAKPCVLLLILLITNTLLTAQEAKKIKILNADEAIDEAEQNRTRMLNNVVFQHDSAYLYCDSAYFYHRQNSLEAFGSVHFQMNDTIHLYCKQLIYNGNSRIAHAIEQVVLKDNTMTLYTQMLDYYRNENYAYYPHQGRIESQDNQLFSDIGYYYSNSKDFHFQRNVMLKDSIGVLLSDTLLYNTATTIATIVGPTEMISENRYAYCENGWYDTETNNAQLFHNVCATEASQITYCDSVYYDHTGGIARAFGHIFAIDTAQSIAVSGNYAEYHRLQHFGFVVDSAIAFMIDHQDTLFLHADTLFVQQDTTDALQLVSAYHHAKFFRRDLQGACDSIVYAAKDSTLRLYTAPVLWAETNQMTADSVYLFVNNSQIDSMTFFQNAFIIAHDTLENYNQIKGKTIVALFKDNEIQRITALGNAESVYYVRDEDKQLIGIDKGSSSLLYILLKNNEFESVTYLKDAKATLFPQKEFPEEFKRMRGFQLQTNRRPNNKDEIFIQD